MKKLTYFASFLFCGLVLLSSCSKAESSSDSDSDYSSDSTEAKEEVAESKPVVRFQVFSGEIKGPISEANNEPMGLSYNIAWPIDGDEASVTALRSWIVSQINGGIYSPGQELQEILDGEAKNVFANNDGFFTGEAIEVKGEANTPFDGYATLETSKEGYYWMANHPPLPETAAIIMRLADRKMIGYDVLAPKKAIKEVAKARALITKYLKQEYPDEEFFFEGDVTLPESNLQLSKDGISFCYNLYEIAPYCTGCPYVTIPYAEVLPLLSDELKSYLPESIVKESK